MLKRLIKHGPVLEKNLWDISGGEIMWLFRHKKTITLDNFKYGGGYIIFNELVSYTGGRGTKWIACAINVLTKQISFMVHSPYSPKCTSPHDTLKEAIAAYNNINC